MRLNQYKDDDESSNVPEDARARYEQRESLDEDPEASLAWNGKTRVLVEAMSEDMVTSLCDQIARVPGRRVTVDRKRLARLLDVLGPPREGDPEDGDRVTFYLEPGAPLVVKRPGTEWCLLIAPLVADTGAEDTPVVSTRGTVEGD